jgi:transcription-repair coupling factor (superfamily II helicase)
MINQEKNFFKTLAASLGAREKHVELQGVTGGACGFFLSGLWREISVPMVVIAPSATEAEACVRDMQFIGNGRLPILEFPPYQLLSLKMVSQDGVAATRLSTLYQMMNSFSPPLVVTSVEALLQRVIPRQELIDFCDLIQVNESIHLENLVEKLVSGGYSRTMIVEEPGDFCVRGGIVDIFSPLYLNPVRVELWGDMVESLRFFSAETQRTIHPVEEIIVIPAKETILRMADMDKVLTRIREQAAWMDLPATAVRDIVERIRNEGIFPGIENLTPLVYTQMDGFLDYVSENSLIVTLEPEESQRNAERILEKASKQHFNAIRDQQMHLDPVHVYVAWNEIQRELNQRCYVALNSVGSPISPEFQPEKQLIHTFSIETNQLLQESLQTQREKEQLLLPLAAWIQEQKVLGMTVVAVCSTGAQGERLGDLLQPYGVKARIFRSFPENIQETGGTFLVVTGSLSSGFVWPDVGIAIVTEDEIFGKKHHRRRFSKPKIQTERLILGELKSGNLVVHQDHGIGQYEGLLKLTIDGATDDFLQIVYRDGDRLYLPVVRMNMVRKYLGIEGIGAVLDKMGGKSWDRVRQQVKKSVEKIAGELLKLYSIRKVADGYSFTGMDDYFKDFEAGFAYEETPDQLRAIEEVLQDMQSSRPMDRLICGDVGYGKTEVALRAAFLAVNNSKQVAVLVPTTVLAEQHAATFFERFKRYPIRIETLSRFRTQREQRTILEGLRSGGVDIVIGTHRLLQPDVEFRDLGLMVLDEEHRFGVKHKEKLKKLKENIDVLTLTATPIPRTLHMSLLGVRDISVISTPPEHRQAIVSYVLERDDLVIVDAIRKELARNGQIYFVHNNTHTIYSMAERLRELVPEVRLDVAHGQMPEKDLEGAMMRFMKHDIDMLVCTTIIESGLDIPLANTMIVNRADTFGLSQLYQLRGRIGRSSEQAYAYLFVPADHRLTRDAQKRLKVLMEHSDLGAGFEIAMNDLKLRGGGTILGASQSGHIAAVGYDMFLQLMEEAVAELKGEPIRQALEPDIHMPVSAYIPETFVPDIDQRMAIYRRLTRMNAIHEIAEYKKELTDRFGTLPEMADNLLLKIMFRILCIHAGVKRLDLNRQQLLLRFSRIHQRNPFGIVEWIHSENGRCELTPDEVLKVKLGKHTISGILGETKNILKEIIQHVNQ